MLVLTWKVNKKEIRDQYSNSVVFSSSSEEQVKSKIAWFSGVASTGNGGSIVNVGKARSSGMCFLCRLNFFLDSTFKNTKPSWDRFVTCCCWGIVVSWRGAFRAKGKRNKREQPRMPLSEWPLCEWPLCEWSLEFAFEANSKIKYKRRIPNSFFFFFLLLLNNFLRVAEKNCLLPSLAVCSTTPFGSGDTVVTERESRYLFNKWFHCRSTVYTVRIKKDL